MTTTLSWQIAEEQGRTRVVFRGDLDEDSDLAELGRRLRGAVEFELGGIERINSSGVREWVSFVHEIVVTRLEFCGCSPAVVAQLNMIRTFRGIATVRSLFVPFFCERCHAEARRLVDVSDGLDAIGLACARCGGAMELDDLPERYFSFLSDGRAP